MLLFMSVYTKWLLKEEDKKIKDQLQTKTNQNNKNENENENENKKIELGHMPTLK